MKIILLNIDKFVQANKLKPCTDGMLLDRGYHPNPDGLLSTEIFGVSSKERRVNFGYIDLNCHVLQPLVYKTLRRVDRRIDKIIAGSQKFSINAKGELIEDEKGDCGLEWLYKNWSKIKFKTNDSTVRNARVKILNSHTRDEIFQSKELVIPAFYRDVSLTSVNEGSKPAVHEINAMYGKLIRLASTMNQGDFAFNLRYNQFQIQNTVIDIYNELKSKLEKKRGLIRQSILGKTVDYGARLVISSVDRLDERPSDSKIDFYHTGLPLAYCISTFTPFVIGWVKKFFTNQFELMGFKMPFTDKKTGKVSFYKLKDAETQFTDEIITEMINKFLHSSSSRFDPILFKVEGLEGKQIAWAFPGTVLTDYDEKQSSLNNPDNQLSYRAFTYTDLFYMAAMDVCKDKHIYITRYPIADYKSTFPIGIAVLSTAKTCKMKIFDKEYSNYPIVDPNLPKEEIPTKFIEVLTMSNVFLESIGGDFDGDQVSVKGVFSQEANAEAEKRMKSIIGIVSINGRNTRSSTIEVIQCLYSVTKWQMK